VRIDYSLTDPAASSNAAVKSEPWTFRFRRQSISIRSTNADGTYDGAVLTLSCDEPYYSYFQTVIRDGQTQALFSTLLPGCDTPTA
jgi:hypothetical protein